MYDKCQQSGLIDLIKLYVLPGKVHNRRNSIERILRKLLLFSQIISRLSLMDDASVITLAGI